MNESAAPQLAGGGDAARSSGVVSLLTDFGLKDPFVGIMKAVMLRYGPQLKVIDLCHGVPPGQLEIAGFFLERSFRWFPEGSVHCCVVDPGVGSARQALAALADGHYFVGPDNGVFSPVFANASHVEVRRIQPERVALTLRSRTFHGRDLFAPVAAGLASGKFSLAALGEAVTPSELTGPTPFDHQTRAARKLGESAEGRVIVCDHFGNLITNLPGEWLNEHCRAEIAGRSLRVVGTYSDAQPGELVALVSSFETLEIAQRDGSAERMLGVGSGARVFIRGPGAGTKGTSA